MLLKRFQTHLKLTLLYPVTINIENAVEDIIINLNVFRIILIVIPCSQMLKNASKHISTLLKILYLPVVAIA